MSRGLWLGAGLLALLSFPLANAATAGVFERAGGAVDPLLRSAPVTRVQYDVSDAGDFCWYDQGWRGPGWYLCGDEWDAGVGWGGPYGWNGWGGHRRRHHRWHNFGGARPATPIRRIHDAGRPTARSGSPPRHAQTVHATGLTVHSYRGTGFAVHSFGGASLAAHGFGGVGATVPSYGAGSGAVHSFAAPATGNFGGAGAHGFGGASFPSAASAAHGGMGH